jgi:hypothetical protein
MTELELEADSTTEVEAIELDAELDATEVEATIELLVVSTA